MAVAQIAEPDDLGRILAKSRIASDLRSEIAENSNALTHAVMIEVNTDFPGGAHIARSVLLADYLDDREVSVEGLEADSELGLVSPVRAVDRRKGYRFRFAASDEIDIGKSAYTDTYLFGRLTPETIARLTEMRESGDAPSPVQKAWLDTPCRAFIDASYRTIKCDAAQSAFGSLGKDIVWAVADTGIQADHPHFVTHDTLELPKGLRHRDFTEAHPTAAASEDAARSDTDGHGTHVGGIVAGEFGVTGAPLKSVAIEQMQITANGGELAHRRQIDRIAGIAPLAKLMSLKVLTDKNTGLVSSMIAAIGYIQRLNSYGRRLRVHGLNLSLGYPFDPKVYGVGQTPLCREVNLLVRSGVVVVVAAGNSGYGTITLDSGAAGVAAFASSIADPGNAELAITVGSTHRDRPHEFGVSFFSSRGPTADGRDKPDLLAPGERIVSCAIRPKSSHIVGQYTEMTGTSMAAPHVSGAIAAFLSSRQEFIGKPEEIKTLFKRSATCLGRTPQFQGAGLIDLMRALQAV